MEVETFAMIAWEAGGAQSIDRMAEFGDKGASGTSR
jgi:hypothetical protein